MGQALQSAHAIMRKNIIEAEGNVITPRHRAFDEVLRKREKERGDYADRPDPDLSDIPGDEAMTQILEEALVVAQALAVEAGLKPTGPEPAWWKKPYQNEEKDASKMRQMSTAEADADQMPLNHDDVEPLEPEPAGAARVADSAGGVATGPSGAGGSGMDIEPSANQIAADEIAADPVLESQFGRAIEEILKEDAPPASSYVTVPGTGGKEIYKDSLIGTLNAEGADDESLSPARLQRMMRKRNKSVDAEGVHLKYGYDFAMQFESDSQAPYAVFGRVERIIKAGDSKRKPVHGPVVLEQTEHKYEIEARWFTEDADGKLTLEPLGRSAASWPMGAVLMPVALYYEDGIYTIEEEDRRQINEAIARHAQDTETPEEAATSTDPADEVPAPAPAPEAPAAAAAAAHWGQGQQVPRPPGRVTRARPFGY